MLTWTKKKTPPGGGVKGSGGCEGEDPNRLRPRGLLLADKLLDANPQGGKHATHEDAHDS